MRTDISYYVTDLREGDITRLPPVGIIQYVPGGLNVSGHGVGLFVNLTNDSDEGSLLVDRESEGVVEFDLPEGLVILTRLNLGNYKDRVFPYINGNPGPFESDDAVNEHFHKFLTGA